MKCGRIRCFLFESVARRRGKIILAAAVLVATHWQLGKAGAAELLQADLMPQALRARSESPIPVEVKFKWEAKRILQGRLEVELHEGSRILGRFRSGDLALTSGEQSFRMLLPASLAPFSDSQVEAQMKFVTGTETIDLGASSLFMSAHGERSLAIAWCSARAGTEQPPIGLNLTLLFEQFVPPAASVARRALLTSLVRLTPDELPAQPLSYTAFDLVVLTADGFAGAREGQLRLGPLGERRRERVRPGWRRPPGASALVSKRTGGSRRQRPGVFIRQRRQLADQRGQGLAFPFRRGQERGHHRKLRGLSRVGFTAVAAGRSIFVEISR